MSGVGGEWRGNGKRVLLRPSLEFRVELAVQDIASSVFSPQRCSDRELSLSTYPVLAFMKSILSMIRL